MQRYVILIASVVMQMCLGATYSWSVYVKHLKEITGLPQGPVQLPFSVFYFAFPATMILAGSLLRRIGPRLCAMGGGLLFGGGWIVAGLGERNFTITVLGIGLMAGIGVGFAYIVPIATCIQWFPRHKGLVTGIAVAGFGGGAALVTQVAGYLMSHQGSTPFQAFVVLGAAFLVLVMSAGYCMQHPPQSIPRRGKPLAVRQVISDPLFRVLYLAMFTGLSAGFAVNANLKELFPHVSIETGIRAVALFAVANAAGRISWGWVFDWIGACTAIQINLFLQAILLVAAPLVLSSAVGLLVFSFLAGLNYGGVLVLYATSVANHWGSGKVGQVYGLLFSANIPAAISPILAGLIFDRTGSFTIPLWGIGGGILVAVILVRWSASLFGPDN